MVIMAAHYAVKVLFCFYYLVGSLVKQWLFSIMFPYKVEVMHAPFPSVFLTTQNVQAESLCSTAGINREHAVIYSTVHSAVMA